MSEEIVVSENKEETPLAYFAATNASEMANAQSQLVAWVESKLRSINAEIRELTTTINSCKEKKWGTKTLQSQKNRVAGRRTYYEKMLAALQAGYVMIPSFPIQSFAIRTAKKWPNGSDETTGTRVVSSPDQTPEGLPVGEGVYVSPTAKDHITARNEKRGDKYELVRRAVANEFQEIEFPLIAAKPMLMDSTSRAMALKIFDTLGIAPDFRAKGDPIIVGEIRGPKQWYSFKACRFLISWHINVEDL